MKKQRFVFLSEFFYKTYPADVYPELVSLRMQKKIWETKEKKVSMRSQRCSILKSICLMIIR